MTRTLVLLLAIAALSGAACTSPSAGGAASLPDLRTAVPSASAVPPTPEPSPPPSLAPLSEQEAWIHLIPGDPASISYPSLAAITRDSDLVVVATPGEIVRGPANKDEFGMAAYMATLTLNIEQVIRGKISSRQPGSVALWVLLGAGEAEYDYQAEFERYEASVPRGRTIFFLSNMAAKAERNGFPTDDPQADPYAYQVLGGQGFLREVGGRLQPAQLSDDALMTMAGRWQEDLRGRPFDDVVRTLEAIAAATP